ncbi:MAG TPA: DUF3016 domain-containing protein [Opitutaceae bacterium]|nr:DUF3016 domain-containing protein [Opitutaceae bacterium]
MNTPITLRFLFAAATLFVFGQTARAQDAAPSKATVTFENPERFTDVKDSISGTDKGRDHYLKLIRMAVEEQAKALLPAGQKLAITFTDIDLAGDYLPSMAANQDIRVMKDIYMPRMKFTYAITDEAGAVVKEGTENLSDVNYLQNIGIVGRNDPLYHDLTMLRDWLRKTLK